MNLRLLAAHPAFTWITILWIGLCCAGWQDYPSQKSIALLPWVLLFFLGKEGLTSLRKIGTRYKFATYATLLLAMVIFANDALHGFTKTGLRHLTASLVWLPIAALAFALLRRNQRNAERLILVASIALAISALVSIVQFVILHQDRPTGLNHNIHSGIVALINLCVIVALSFHTLGERQKIEHHGSGYFRLVAISTVCAIFILVLSGARSPLVAIAFATVFLVALLRHHVRFASMLSILIVGGLLVALGYERSLDIAKEVASYIAGDHATSLGGRLDAWRWFAEQGLTSPWLGQSSDAVTTNLALRGERWGLGNKQLIEMLHLHNDLLQLTAAYGIFATGAFVCVIVGFGADALKTIVRERDRSVFSMLLIPSCIVSAVCLVAVTGITDSLTYWSISWIAWTSAIGVMLALSAHRAAID